MRWWEREQEQRWRVGREDEHARRTVVRGRGEDANRKENKNKDGEDGDLNRKTNIEGWRDELRRKRPRQQNERKGEIEGRTGVQPKLRWTECKRSNRRGKTIRTNHAVW